MSSSSSRARKALATDGYCSPTVLSSHPEHLREWLAGLRAGFPQLFSHPKG